MNKKRLFYTMLFNLLMIKSFSQKSCESGIPITKAYTVDSTLNTIIEQVDFDIPFYINKFYSFEIEPTRVGLMKFRALKFDKPYEVKDSLDYSTFKEKDKTKLRIQICGLDPGKFYGIVIQRKMNSNETEDFYNYINSLFEKNLNFELITDDLINYINKNSSFLSVSYSDSTYCDSLRTFITNYKKENDNYKLLITAKDFALAAIKGGFEEDTSCINEFISKLYQCENCKTDSSFFLGNRAGINIQNLVNLLVSLNYAISDTDLLKRLLNGCFALGSLNITTLDTLKISNPDIDLNKNIENLTKTLEQLNQVRITAGYLAKISMYNNYELDRLLHNIIVLVNLFKGKYGNILQKQKELKTKLKEGYFTIRNSKNIDVHYLFFEKYDLINSTTRIFNFSTRNKTQITPEFGLVYYGLDQFSKENNNFHGLMPYVGFHINFRAINPEAIFRLLPKKNALNCRLSAFVGFSLNSVKKPGEREDFFSSTDLLLGMGVRLGTAVRLVTGGVIFKKDSNTNPLITNYKYASTPFAGLSLDLRLSDLLKGINKIINL